LAARSIEVIVLQLGNLDLTSAAGKMMMAMPGAIAGMERDLLVERTQAGLTRAKAGNKMLGRPKKTLDAQRAEIITKHQADVSISELARQYGISRLSIARIAKAEGAQA
jgi:DNA invertase Pin-like site-specific DNA recombinase